MLCEGKELSGLSDLSALGKIKLTVTRMPLAEATRGDELVGKGAVKGKGVQTATDHELPVYHGGQGGQNGLCPIQLA